MTVDPKSLHAELTVEGKTYSYISLKKLKEHFPEISQLPFSLKVLLENVLRHYDPERISESTLESLSKWALTRTQGADIPFMPARVLMQDFTGVPAVVDLAAIRDAVAALGQDPKKINPQSAVDLVIDHSVIVDHFASNNAFEENKSIEYDRNKERYTFLKWGQNAFENFRVVPPGAGICHQVNLENLAPVVGTKTVEGITWAFPDTLVGTDSHTTMVNALGVLGWGVGGIEAEAAMLGQPYSMRIPEVIGVKLEGTLPAGATATDLVLTITQKLREKGVVGKFVEFFGPGLDALSLADRATISNMAPEYGATCGFFPIDEATLTYLRLSGRKDHQIQLVEAYAKEQGLWRDPSHTNPTYTSLVGIDLTTIETSLAGPKRPQDRLTLPEVAPNFQTVLKEEADQSAAPSTTTLDHGAVVIAAITSCTNTSNPSVMIGAGLVAKKARALGLSTKPWVKTSLAPGSQVVTDYLEKTGLQEDLDALGFNLVGYGCTTCIGNSGPLSPEIETAIKENNLVVTSVLSGNRNFEGRVNPLVKANYLASPPLVVAYALAGSTLIDLSTQPLGQSADGTDIYLKDIWPTQEEVAEELAKAITPEMFKSRYAKVFEGDNEWQQLPTTEADLYAWDDHSTYVKNPPYFDGMTPAPTPVGNILNAKALAILGDSVTTDHISPAGSIPVDGPAGLYLKNKGIQPKDFNSFGARRGNHEIMMRGTFANIRIRNEMVPGVVGGKTLSPKNPQEVIPIYDAAMLHQQAGTPLVVIAGKEYGTGSSRDWAAKGTKLLGVKSVIAESFERIHRSNLIGMGVLPLVFQTETRKTLNLNGTETFSLTGLNALTPGCTLTLQITRDNGDTLETSVLCRIDTSDELQYYQNGGILPYVIRSLTEKT